MALILVEKDGKNRVAKEVTTDQRTAIMAKSRIWDIDASGAITAGPFGPTNPDPVPVPAAGITNDGTTATDTVAREMATAASTAASEAQVLAGAAAWMYPGIGPKFPRAIEGMPMVEDQVFGTSVAVGSSSVSTAIRNATQLALKYNPFGGDFVNGVHVGGTGPTTINSEVQRYSGDFAGPNFVWESDALRLQAVLSAGHFSTYLRGQCNMTAGTTGMVVNAPGGTTPTAIGDIGITSGELSATGNSEIEVGDMVSIPNGFGWAVVAAKDTGAGTITFENVNANGNTTSTARSNYHIAFTKFAAARVDSTVTNGSTTVIRFKKPLPSSVVPGCFVQGGLGWALTAYGEARVQSIASSVNGSRTEVTFDAPVFFPNYQLTAANNGIVVFVPGLTSGQAWSKTPRGAQRSGKRGYAARIELTCPGMSKWAANPAYTKADVLARLSANPDALYGYWIAVWLFMFGSNVPVPGGRSGWSEIDILELWIHLWMGPDAWTGNLHDVAFIRKVNKESWAQSVRGMAAAWRIDAADNKNLTPNSKVLVTTAPIASGTKFSVGVVQTRDKVIHYLNDLAICESDWSSDVDYPYQLAFNMACGSLDMIYASNLMYPQSDANATGQFLKVHRVQEWEL